MIRDEILSEISYVKMSTYRLRVVESLGLDVKMPSEISKDSEVYQNHISNVLRQLKDHDLVECINPEMRKGRLYRLTPKGLEVFENINNYDL